MIGDDLVNDVGGAQYCGMKGVQVRTGKYRSVISSSLMINFVSATNGAISNISNSFVTGFVLWSFLKSWKSITNLRHLAKHNSLFLETCAPLKERNYHIWSNVLWEDQCLFSTTWWRTLNTFLHWSFLHKPSCGPDDPFLNLPDLFVLRLCQK